MSRIFKAQQDLTRQGGRSRQSFRGPKAPPPLQRQIQGHRPSCSQPSPHHSPNPYRSQTREQTRENIRGQVCDQSRDQIRDQIREQIRNQKACPRAKAGMGGLGGAFGGAKRLGLARGWRVMVFALASLLSQGGCKDAKKAKPQKVPSPLSSEAKDKTKKDPKAPDLSQSSFPLTLWAAFLAQRDYVDPKRFSVAEQIDGAMSALESAAPKVFARRHGGSIEVSVDKDKKTFEVDTRADLRHAAKVLESILEFAVPRLELSDDERHELEYAAFNGLVTQLDPHTLLLTPKQNARLGVRTRGHFGGIGAEILADERRIRIVRVLPKTPAEKAGVMDGDLLYQINGRSTVNMTGSEAQTLLRGPVDTVVKVKAYRNKKIIPIEITRGKIEIPAAESYMLPHHSGYVRLLTFQSHSANEVVEAFNRLRKEGAKSIILDLRHNTGGLLTEATALVDAFLDKGTVLSVLSRDGKELEEADAKLKVPAEIPLVILINESSASAAEIVSGALSDHGRAVVAGRRSFGKGSVQQVFPAKPYGEELALKLTIAEYRVGDDHKIQGLGVVPDLALYPMQLSEFKGVGAFFDRERYDEARENAVYGKQDEEVAEEAPKTVHYLAGTPWDRDRPPVDPKDRAQRIWRDKEIQLAAKLGLAMAEAKVYDKKSAGAVLESFEKDQNLGEQGALKKAMARWKVDWKAESPGDRQKRLAQSSWAQGEGIVVKAQLRSKKKRGQASSKRARRKQSPVKNKENSPPGDLGKQWPAIQLGQEFELRLKISNTAPISYHRVHLKTRYLLPELDGIEIAVGKLAPGASKTFDLPLALSLGHAPHHGRLAFDGFIEQKAITSAPLEVFEFEMVDPPRPKLAFDYWIVDSPKQSKAAPKRPKHLKIEGVEEFRVQGDGDGQIDAGEKVLLAFKVKNIGEATAKIPGIVVRNRSREQALLEEGAASLKELKPGQARFAAIAMTVAEKADPKKPLQLELMVGDRQSGEVVKREVEMPLDDKDSPSSSWQEAEEPSLFQSTEDLMLRAEPQAQSPVLLEVPAQTVLRSRGQKGTWTALQGEQGRLFWIHFDGTQLERAAKRARAKPLVGRANMVRGPKLSLEGPSVAAGAELEVRGEARDDRALRDLVVWAIPDRAGQWPKKLLYREFSANDPGGGRHTDWSSRVALEPGYQKIKVVARDEHKVETTQEKWVYRPEAATPPAKPQ